MALLTVSSPHVAIQPLSEPVLAGRQLSLHSSIIVNEAVDNSVSVNVMWTANGVSVKNTSETITVISQVGPLEYIAVLTLLHVGLNDSYRDYGCEVVIKPSSRDIFVLESPVGKDQTSVNVQRMSFTLVYATKSFLLNIHTYLYSSTTLCDYPTLLYCGTKCSSIQHNISEV